MSFSNCRKKELSTKRMNRFPVQLGTDCTRNRSNLKQFLYLRGIGASPFSQFATVVSQKDSKGTVLIAVTLVDTHLFDLEETDASGRERH
jgi:hypothetical protein